MMGEHGREQAPADAGVRVSELFCLVEQGRILAVRVVYDGQLVRMLPLVAKPVHGRKLAEWIEACSDGLPRQVTTRRVGLAEKREPLTALRRLVANGGYRGAFLLTGWNRSTGAPTWGEVDLARCEA